ncbi:MAG: hypothetical protein M1837_001991 [Sclerophora amabilis]|nr:MAG: hypothetical protein M1837_001991 [Sclerophora amabilis]
MSDPYSESGLVEKARKQSRKPAVADEGSASGAAGKLTRLPKKQASVEVEDPDYVPATTWDGLEQVGGQGGWWKKHWDPEHRFQGYAPWSSSQRSEYLVRANLADLM